MKLKFIKFFEQFNSSPITEKKDDKWIQETDMKKGGLSKMLGYSEKENIPDGIIDEIIKEKEGSMITVKGKEIKITKLMKKRANLAKNLKKLK